MSSRNLGLLLAVAGAIAAVALVFHPDELHPGGITDPRWVPVHLALLVSFTLSVPGVVGLWSSQRRALPGWGHWAFLLALVGCTLSVAMVAIEAFALPVAAAHDPRPMMDLLAPDGPYAGAGLLFGIGFLAWIPGWVAAGIATARSGVFPPAVGIALALGAVGVAVPIHFVGGVGLGAHALAGFGFGAAWLVAGIQAARVPGTNVGLAVAGV
jgi:hypothetical protein